MIIKEEFRKYEYISYSLYSDLYLLKTWWYSVFVDGCVFLTLKLLVANLANTKWGKIPEKKTEPLANGYSFESAPRELSNEYQHDRVWMVFKNICICVLWTKVALAFEGLKRYL